MGDGKDDHAQHHALTEHQALTGRVEPMQRAGGVPVTVIRCPLWVPRKVTAIKRIIHLASFGLSSIPAVLWMALRERPDVIMTVEPSAFCMPTTWLAARLTGAKCWLHVQDFKIDAAFELGILRSPLARKLISAAESFWMRRFDRVSSISPNMMLHLVAKGVDETRTSALPNWVDCDLMRPLDQDADFCQRSAREAFGIDPNKFVALYAGNMGAKQGLEMLTEAAQHWHRDGQANIQLVICGDGTARQRTAEATKHLPNVLMLPVQPGDQFNRLMNCADVHLLPQKGNAADLVMPSKLTGMFATGRPVIAGAAAGTQIADVMGTLGLVVPPDDVPAMVEAVRVLAADPSRCKAFGANARQYAVRHLSRDPILNHFRSQLHSLANQPLQEGRQPSPGEASAIDTPF
jgi:colanic acid biosynthesis glycosyl transferase WcaI